MGPLKEYRLKEPNYSNTVLLGLFNLGNYNHIGKNDANFTITFSLNYIEINLKYFEGFFFFFQSY